MERAAAQRWGFCDRFVYIVARHWIEEAEMPLDVVTLEEATVDYEHSANMFKQQNFTRRGLQALAAAMDSNPTYSLRTKAGLVRVFRFAQDRLEASLQGNGLTLPCTTRRLPGLVRLDVFNLPEIWLDADKAAFLHESERLLEES
jgi:hypothetical protein